MPGVLFLVPAMPLPNCGMLEKECAGKPSPATSQTSTPSVYVAAPFASSIALLSALQHDEVFAGWF